MKTYLLSARKNKLAELAASAEAIAIGPRRAVMVFSAGNEPPAEFVVKSFKGNVLAAHAAWAQGNILDELATEFMTRTLPTPAEQQKVITQYKRALAAKQKAEEKLKAAQDAVYEASRELVRHFGRGPVVIDGCTFDVSCSKETVFYIQRSEQG